jgi:hypothetical protein
MNETPDPVCRDISVILKFNFLPAFQSEILRLISSKNSAYQMVNLKILPSNTDARLNFKIALISLHIDPEMQ